MVDLNTITEKVRDIKSRFAEAGGDYITRRGLERLQQGNTAIEEMKPYLTELQQAVQEGHRAAKGALVLAGKNTGDEDGDTALAHLTQSFYGDKSAAMRIWSRFTGRQLTLQDGLETVKRIAGDIPDYVERLSTEQKRVESDLHEYRSEIRDNIDELLATRGPLEDHMAELQGTIETLMDEYGTLERQRKENAERGEQTPYETRERITKLELSISDSREAYSELEAKRNMVEGNVQLLQSQLDRIGEQIDRVSKTRHVVLAAQEFVRIQVPYLEHRVQAQQSSIKAMAGVNEAMTFLQELDDATEKLNERIDSGMRYLGGKVEEIRQQAIEAAGKPRLGSGSQDALPQGREIYRTGETEDV